MYSVASLPWQARLPDTCHNARSSTPTTTVVVQTLRHSIGGIEDLLQSHHGQPASASRLYPAVSLPPPPPQRQSSPIRAQSAAPADLHVPSPAPQQQQQQEQQQAEAAHHQPAGLPDATTPHLAQIPASAALPVMSGQPSQDEIQACVCASVGMTMKYSNGLDGGREMAAGLGM